MDNRDRIICALELGQPDRVPSFIESMMNGFIQKSDAMYGDEIKDSDIVLINGDWTWRKFYGFSGAWLHGSPIQMRDLSLNLEKINLPEETMRLTRWGHIHQERTYVTGYLNTEELWNEWIDAGYFDYTVSADWIRIWEKGYKEALEHDLLLIPVDTIWEKIREAFSFARLAYFLRKPQKRQFLKRLIDRMFDVQEEMVKGVLDAGFEVITLADDTAYKNRVMVNPEIWEELVVPGYTRLNNLIHKRGALSFWHSDGFTEPYFPGLIKSGFNGIQSLEPTAGMDLGHLKQTYGDQVCLIGNVDCSRVLPFATEDEIIEETLKCLRQAAEGGGYIFGPTTDIIDSANPRNVKVMMDTLEKYGAYPLNLP